MKDRKKEKREKETKQGESKRDTKKEERERGSEHSRENYHFLILKNLYFGIKFLFLFFFIPWPFLPFWGVADNTKKTTKAMGVLLLSSTNDEGPGRVWMALLEQHSPSYPLSTTYVTSQMPSPLLPLIKTFFIAEVLKYSIPIINFLLVTTINVSYETQAISIQRVATAR